MQVAVQSTFLDTANATKTPEFDHHRLVKTGSKTSTARITFYIYAEMKELGKGNRSVSKVIKLTSVSRRYQAGDNGSYERVYAGALEKACEIACGKLDELEKKGKSFKRVFVSQVEDMQQAKLDDNALSYYHVKIKQEPNSRLSQVLLTQLSVR